MFQGSNSEPQQDDFLDPAFAEGSLYNIQSQCTPNSIFNVSVPLLQAAPFQNGTIELLPTLTLTASKVTQLMLIRIFAYSLVVLKLSDHMCSKYKFVAQ